MECKKYVIKSDKEGYFYGPSGEPDGSIWFTKDLTNAKQYNDTYRATDDIDRYNLKEGYFNGYIVPVLIDIKEL